MSFDDSFRKDRPDKRLHRRAVKPKMAAAASAAVAEATLQRQRGLVFPNAALFISQELPANECTAE